jgi:hypothetical protein
VGWKHCVVTGEEHAEGKKRGKDICKEGGGAANEGE